MLSFFTQGRRFAWRIIIVLFSAMIWSTTAAEEGEEPNPPNAEDQDADIKAPTAGETIDAGPVPATCFHFTKKGSLIARPPKMAPPGPYYPTMSRMNGIEKFPYEYVLYFSTDHHRGKGGIWLYLCSGDPSEAANWKSYDQALVEGKFDYLKDKPEANPIFVDTVQGRQTETPHVNVIDGKVYMTYHNAGVGRGQKTMLATSTDGVNFARINGPEDSVILPGGAHTGYFRWAPNPFSGVNYKYVGYSLYKGGRNPRAAMWGSQDAVKWERLAVFKTSDGLEVESGLVVGRVADPSSVVPLGDGEYVAISTASTRGASGGMPRRSELYEIFLDKDGRTLTRRPRRILVNGPAGSDDEEEISGPTTVLIGDTWHVIYVGVKENARVNTVMVATGKLDRGAPASPPLEPSAHQRHMPEKK